MIKLQEFRLKPKTEINALTNEALVVFRILFSVMQFLYV